MMAESKKINQYRKLRESWCKTQEDNFGIICLGGEEFREPEDNDCWGVWRYNSKINTLDLFCDLYDGGQESLLYQIDLSLIKTQLSALNWITQISRKSYCTEAILANLVWALDDILNIRSLNANVRG
jgi:hypothetical protein